MRIAVVQGSFDPMTKGHCALIVRAAALFERVIVAIANNVDKTYLFSKRERLEIAQASLAELPNVSVELCDGYVADFAAAHGACCFVRGIRDEKDLAYEKVAAEFNRARADIETVMLFAEGENSGISSTLLRARLHAGENIDDLVAPAAKAILLARFATQQNAGKNT